MGGRKERDTRRGRICGGHFVPLLKNDSNFACPSLAPSLFQPKLSEPVLSDGFTGAGRDWGRQKQSPKTLHSHFESLHWSLVSASPQFEWMQFKEKESEKKTKMKKIKKTAEIRVFQPLLCLFQSTWTAKQMQETAWGSGEQTAGGLPSFSPEVAADRSFIGHFLRLCDAASYFIWLFFVTAWAILKDSVFLLWLTKLCFKHFHITTTRLNVFRCILE